MPAEQLDLVAARDPKPRESTRSVIARAVEAEQDFEFYPTTDEIIRALVKDLRPEDRYGNNHSSVLDIGAGNGKVLNALRSEEIGFRELFAIEKSPILCQQLDPDILIVGTEFAEQSLLSKSVDVIFCNPPYSAFVQWSEKIIRQGAAAVIYLVIPERWTRSVEIADAIKFREAEAKIVGKFDFEDAEDRRARAVVNLVRIELQRERHRDGNDDAFERFFNEEFADLINKFRESEPEKGEREDDGVAKGGRHRPFHQLVSGPGYPEALVNIYNAEMGHVRENYRLVSQLDVDLLREFDISPPRIMACLKNRLAGLRADYWNELFSRLSTITDRLASQSRKNLLETLQRHVHVDFTLSNIYAVVVWVIKNANRYIDSQLIATYELMVDKCNVILYKSNQKTWRDEQWRYVREGEEKPSRYSLDYRIVTHRVGGIRTSYSWEKGLEERAAFFLGDLLTIARNLGFKCHTNDNRVRWRGGEEWKPGAAEVFYFIDKEGDRDMLFDVRAFKNGNIHLRLNKQFILALNVEHGRLKGWLRSPEEAVAELGEERAADFFKSNLQLGRGDVLLLGEPK